MSAATSKEISTTHGLFLHRREQLKRQHQETGLYSEQAIDLMLTLETMCPKETKEPERKTS